MELQLQGRVALVTGATGGIGHSIAQTLLEEGCSVVGVGSSPDSVRRARAGYANFGDQVLLEAADLTVADERRSCLAAVNDRFGRLDVLVNCTARHAPGGESVGEDEWFDHIRVKLLAYYQLIEEALPELRRTRGSIINISGTAGLVPSLQLPQAGAVNAAILNLTRFFAAKLAKEGIRVNSICPGWVTTRRHQDRVDRVMGRSGVSREEAQAQLDARIPLGKVTDPKEIGLLAALICSPLMKTVTGANLVVDGGVSSCTGFA